MLFQVLFALALASVHLMASKFGDFSASPRSRWLSFAGGVSVAYVFVHIFPELQEAQETLGHHGILGFIEHHAYLVALSGLATFYGLERLAKERRKSPPPGDGAHTEAPPGRGVFWLHIGAFALYNALIGYLLVYRESSLLEMFFFVLAMGFHFFVNDHGLSQHHRHEYRSTGRWVLSAAVLVGWGLGQAVQLSDALTSVFFAFLAGGLVLNVLKEELPEERQSRFFPFIGGGVICSVLLLLI